MFWSSQPPDQLPKKGDQVRHNDRGPYTVLRRQRSEDTGSVFLDLQRGDEVIELAPVEACDWWPTIGATVCVATGKLEQLLIQESQASDVSKRVRLFFDAFNPYFDEQPHAQGRDRPELLRSVKALKKQLDQKLTVNRVINGMARCSTVKEGEVLPYGLPVECLRVVKHG